MSHATLRITRDDDATGDDYRFDVWDPVQARYERLATLEEASARLQALASAVRELWIAHAPELDTLREPPDEDGDDEFAELRVTAQANRHYDVRSFDSPGWTHFAGYLDQVLAHICGEVGYVVQQSVPPLAHDPSPVRRLMPAGGWGLLVGRKEASSFSEEKEAKRLY